MNISSTDAERYEEIKDRVLRIVPWDAMREMKITDGSKSYSSAVKAFAKDLGIINSFLDMEGMDYPVKFTVNSVKESIKHTFELTALAKMFTVLPEVAENAILIKIEPYRHLKHPKAALVQFDKQYLSAFYDENFVYPVKITVEERHNVNDTNAYITIAVGQIKKEALSFTGKSGKADNTPSGGITSLEISITDFVKFFNRNQGKIIKNLPDGMLTEKQKRIKEKLIDEDNRKEQMISEYKAQLQTIKDKIAEIEKDDPQDYDEPEEDYGK